MPSRARDEWLSLTPEPEDDLPAAIATLRAGGNPTPEAIEAESERAERLVRRASRRRWLAWLREAVELADARGQHAPEVAAAREVVIDVVDNHDALQLGLPGGRRRGSRSDSSETETFERIRVKDEKGPR